MYPSPQTPPLPQTPFAPPQEEIVSTTLGVYVDRLIQRIRNLEREVAELRADMHEMRANMHEYRSQFSAPSSTVSDLRFP